MKSNTNLKIIVFFLLSFFILEIALQTHEFGIPKVSEMDDYFIKNSQKETATNNVVTAIIFDYRGFDTLGEATVMFTAIVGIAMLLFRKEKAKEEERGEEDA